LKEQKNQSFVQREDKLIGVEVLRFISAITVLLWHYQHFSYVGSKPTQFVREQQPFFALLSPLYEHGLYGVQVFWCISGFIFFWKYATDLSAGRVSWKNFAVARFSRLYPLHVLTLLAVAALQFIYFSRHGYYFVYQANDVYHFMLQLGMASNWSPDFGYSFNAPIWSISIEVVVYVFFFVASNRFAATSFLAVLAIIVVAASGYAYIGNSSILECLMCFYIGGLTAILYVMARSWSRETQSIFNYCALIAAACLIVGLYSGAEVRKVLYVAVPISIYLCCIYIIPTGQRLTSFISMLGNLTYSSYLLHFPIQLSLALVFSYLGRPIPYNNSAFFIVFFSITLFLAWLFYGKFEMPWQYFLRSRLIKKRRPGIEAV
jgi:peptidoglycan/LPS O-acetylase OafA/YrhL